MTKQKDCMENEKLTERESLELITRMIERARKTEIGRLNFVTLYGVLGLVMYTLSLIWPVAPFLLLWMAVPVLSYGVPFFYHKMWRKQTTVTGDIMKRCWGMLALTGVTVPLLGSLGNPAAVTPLMVIVGCCALFMLSGVYRQKTILWASFVGFAFNVLPLASDGTISPSTAFWSYVFFAYCVYIGLSLRGKADEIKQL